MEKKIISPFEFAIREICEPETLSNYRPMTRVEKAKEIEDNIRSTMSRMKVKTKV